MKITRNGHEYELTATEMRLAYEEQDRYYDKLDLENFFDSHTECEEYGWYNLADRDTKDAILEYMAEKYHEVTARHDTWEDAMEAISELDYERPGWQEEVISTAEAIAWRAAEEARYDAWLDSELTLSNPT